MKKSWLLISLAAFAVVSAVGVWNFTQSVEVEDEEDTSENHSSVQEQIIRYGMNLTGCQLLSCAVEPRELITDIFSKHNIATSAAAYIISESKDIFNPRRLRAGNNYTVVLAPTDSGMVPSKLIYEEDKVNYVVFNLDDSLYIWRGKHAVVRKRKEVGGIVKSSLYETLESNSIPSSIAVRMSNIFACVIDFYRIQQGDYFKIIYDEDFVEGESVGVGTIHACLFNSSGKDYQAYYFQKDASHEGDFYDEKGESMKRQFLKAPLEFFRISSRFSKARLHPVTRQMKAHLGTDYAAPYGTPIMSTADGVVEEASYKANNGNYVKVRHNGQYKTQYLHMSKIAKGVRPGVRVRQGEVIGYVGSTGLATGPHVCYRFWKDGQQVDPSRQKLAVSEPLPEKYKSVFLQKIEPLKNKLSAISTDISKNVQANASDEAVQSKSL